MPLQRPQSSRRAASVALSALSLASLVLLARAGVASADDAPPSGAQAAPKAGRPPAPQPPPPAAPADRDASPSTARRLPGEAPPPEVFDTLPEVMVQAPTLTVRSVFETTAPVNAIGGQTLQREAPRTFSEAIRNQPGLWNTQGSNGQMGTPVIRGAQGNQVLLLWDGVRLSNDLTEIGPGTYWELLDMEAADHIEVLRSPDSVLYGTQAIGGVTAVYTAFPLDFTAGGTVTGGHSRLTLTGGGENFVRWRVQGQAASPRVRLVAGATVVDAGDQEGGGDTGPLIPTNYDTQAADARVEWRASSCDTLGFSVFGMQKTWPDNFIRPARDYDNWMDREMAIVRWRHEAPSRWSDDFELRLALAHNGRLYERHDKWSRDAYDVYTPQVDFVAHKGLARAHALTYGLHAHEDRVNAWTDSAATGKIHAVAPGWLFDAGAFVQDEWQATSRLRVTAGVRFDAVWVSTDPDPATTDPLVNPDDIRVDRSDTAWTGKLGVLYEATEHVALTANLSRGYRFPGVTDLSAFRQVPDEIQVGNPKLDPEYSTTLDVGTHLRGCNWSASVVGYYTWMEDLIIGKPGFFNGTDWVDRNGNGVRDPDEDLSIRTNAGTAEVYGVEAAAAWMVRPGWTLFGNFTWWLGSYSPPPTEPTGVPTNGTVGVRFEPNERLWSELTCHMVHRFDRIPEDFYDEEQFFWKDPQDGSSGPMRSTSYVPGYATFDLRGGYRVTDSVTVVVGVENLLDRQYRPFGARHDAPGITGVLSVSLDF